MTPRILKFTFFRFQGRIQIHPVSAEKATASQVLLGIELSHKTFLFFYFNLHLHLFLFHVSLFLFSPAIGYTKPQQPVLCF